jgi:transposase
MYSVELYGRIRRAVFVEGKSRRAVAKEFGIARETVRKMLRYAVPPGYRREQAVKRPKLGPWLGMIDAILKNDQNQPKKQRHTAKRIFDRLREEHGYTGGYTVVKDYVRLQKVRKQEMFVPLTHAPGEAQADFGEALVVIAGAEQKTRYFVLDLPQSDDCLVAAYPAETTEAFLDAHVRAFDYLGGVPRFILYDNTKLAVARFWGTGSGRRRGHLRSCRATICLRNGLGGRRLGGLCPAQLSGAHPARQQLGTTECATAGAVPEAARATALGTPGDDWRALPARPYSVAALAGDTVRGLREAHCEGQFAVAGALPDQRYSVPTEYGHREVLVKGYVHEVVIACGSEVIARHRRSYQREDMIFDPLHYLALLEEKLRALDQAAPLAGWELPGCFAELRRLLEARLGQHGKREYVQVLRLLETFPLPEVTLAVEDALRLGTIQVLAGWPCKNNVARLKQLRSGRCLLNWSECERWGSD